MTCGNNTVLNGQPGPATPRVEAAVALAVALIASLDLWLLLIGAGLLVIR